jgi:hypothetical protein
LERLATSPELRGTLGIAGRRTVEAHYSAESSAARLAEAVRLVLRGGRDPRIDYRSTTDVSRSARDG